MQNYFQMTGLVSFKKYEQRTFLLTRYKPLNIRILNEVLERGEKIAFARSQKYVYCYMAIPH